MKHTYVKRSVAEAMRKDKLSKSGSPKLLSDNGSCYISGELKSFLSYNYNIEQLHGRPAHPQTQGKIERYHRSMKNVVKLNNYYYTTELESAISSWVEHYNNSRYHESLGNLTPADVYFGHGDEILATRAKIKQESLKNRKLSTAKGKLYFEDVQSGGGR